MLDLNKFNCDVLYIYFFLILNLNIFCILMAIKKYKRYRRTGTYSKKKYQSVKLTKELMNVPRQ